MQVFRQRFHEPVCQSLEHDGIVIVLYRLEFFELFFDTDSGCHAEQSDIVPDAGRFRGDEIGKTLVGAGYTVCLLYTSQLGFRFLKN